MQWVGKLMLHQCIRPDHKICHSLQFVTSFLQCSKLLALCGGVLHTRAICLAYPTTLSLGFCAHTLIGKDCVGWPLLFVNTQPGFSCIVLAFANSGGSHHTCWSTQTILKHCTSSQKNICHLLQVVLYFFVYTAACPHTVDAYATAFSPRHSS